MTRNRWLVLIGLLVSAGLAWLVVDRLDWPVFWAALDRLTTAPVVLAIPVMIGGIVARGFRWMLIVMGKPSHVADFLRATCLGYFANTVLPLRAGEILRVVAVQRLTGIPVARAMAGAVADRLLDAISLGVMLVAVLAVHGAAVADITAGPLDLALVAAGFLAVVAALVWGRRWRGAVSRFSRRLPSRIGGRITIWYKEIMSVFITLREPRILTAIGSLTALAIAADLFFVWLVMVAFGWTMPVMAAATVVVFLNLGGLLPAASGYIGIFQVACLFALGLYGVAESEAIAYSVVLQLLVIFLLVTLGAIATISCGDRLGPWRRARPGDRCGGV